MVCCILSEVDDLWEIPGTGRRRHPGLLDFEEAKKSGIVDPLATARDISDIHSVPGL